ncbi:turripeptide Ici9.1-like [Colossoma macropomum]|uniref:turripeptide Ici9.1-like n=1 Tax=Colossoma macropomum TaxID=42526 RepID=UPI001863AEFB|nr:turripeptide Ici9.1-like [Colossoma macropomum]
MKLAVLLCVSLLLCWSAFTAADEAYKPNCAQYANSVCLRYIDPVCGDDGNTYPNECVLCMESTVNNQYVMVAYKGKCGPV